MTTTTSAVNNAKNNASSSYNSCFGSLTGNTLISMTIVWVTTCHFCNRSRVWGHNWEWNYSFSFNLAYGKAVSDWWQPFQTSSGRHHQTKQTL